MLPLLDKIAMLDQVLKKEHDLLNVSTRWFSDDVACSIRGWIARSEELLIDVKDSIKKMQTEDAEDVDEDVRNIVDLLWYDPRGGRCFG
jgi:hypothetical protein